MITRYNLGSVKLRLLVVAGSIITLGLISLVVFITIDSNREGAARATAIKFVSTINDQRYDEGYSLLRETPDTAISLGTWILWVNGFEEANMAIEQEPSTISSIDDGLLHSTYSVTHAIDGGGDLNLTVAYIDDQWHVSAFNTTASDD